MLKNSVNNPLLNGVVAALAVLALGACMAPVGAEGVSVPPDSASICAGHCQSIGLRLSAVAIMANNVGCVCQPAGASGAAAPALQSSVSAAGMSTILMQRAAAERARQQQEQQQQQQRLTQRNR